MNMKKTVMCALSAAALGVTAVCSSLTSAADTADSPAMREGLTAAQVAEEMGLGINLGNTMEAYNASNCEKITYEWIPKIGSNTPKDYETCWGAVETTQEVIDGMNSSGFNTVRIPVFWGNMMENDGTYTINEDYLERIGEIVDYCQNADMYAVVNIHHFDEFIIRRNSLEDCQRIFDTLWTQIADYFKDYPDTVVFEGFNEYLGGQQFNENGELEDMSRSDAYEMTNTLNQTFVDAVRSTGGNNAERVLVVSGYWTNIDNTTSDRFVMPSDTVENKLMVSVHYVDNSKYWERQIGGDGWREYSIDQCEKLKRAFGDKGIPVFIGETTSVYPSENFAWDADVKNSSEALDYMLRLITDYGFTPVLWDTNGNFYDRVGCHIKKSSDAKVISTLAAELAGTPVSPDLSSVDSVESVSESSAESADSSSAVSSDSSSSVVSAEDTSSNTVSKPETSSVTSSAPVKNSTAAGASDANPNTAAGGTFAIVLLVAGAAGLVVSMRGKK